MATNDVFPSAALRSLAAPTSSQTASPAQRRIARVPEHAWRNAPLFTKTIQDGVAPDIFPVVESPRFVFSAESRFRTEQEIVAACGGAGPLAFLLIGSTICSLSPVTPTSEFGPAIEQNRAPSQEPFAGWLSDSRRSHEAIQLLDRSLRRHAWKRGLRFTEAEALFYFTRSKPKNLWWEFEGKIAQREVTAPLMQSYRIEDGREVELQRGWKHEAVRAAFTLHEGRVSLRFEPAWLLTELDGKTPATRQTVTTVGSRGPAQAEAELIRTLRFWSAVFAKSHRELRIETGAGPIRVRLTPASSQAPRIIAKDRLNFEDFSPTAIESDQLIPELSPALT
jgi:hypothetical protein